MGLNFSGPVRAFLCFEVVAVDLQRVEMLIGSEKLARLQQAYVAVLGLGGVGSYVAEALCRSGVGRLLLIDADVIAPSNINRQLPALQCNLGRLKTEVVAERLRQINPECQIKIISRFYEPGDFAEFFASRTEAETVYPDYLADAIDATASKVDVIVNACKLGVPLISAMGTGNKLDPTLLRVADISKTSVCPLAKSIRKHLRSCGIEKGVTVVYSLEQPQCVQKSSTPGSMVFVPASAGLLMASYIIRQLIREQEASL